MKLELVQQINDAVAAGRTLVVATRLGDGERRVLEPGAEGALAEAAAQVRASDRACVVEHEGEEWFIQSFSPPLRLIIVGAVHVAQFLAPMARLSGFSVSVVDPRRAFATESRFPDTELHARWPARAFPDLRPDARTAVVTLTHDPKIDDPGLCGALDSDAFYIGALGSRRTHAGRLERLAEAGYSAEQLARIHGPVGLNIGARSPAEIAVSILGEMVQVLRQGRAAA